VTDHLKSPKITLSAPDEIGNHSILIHLNVKPKNTEDNPFGGYITVGKKTNLEVTVRNLTDHQIDKLKTEIFIDCPNNVVRKCSFEIALFDVNAAFSKTFKNFFIPEVPGSHLLSICHQSPYRFISSPGLAGSEFRITGYDQISLPFSFDVYSANDLMTLQKMEKQEMASAKMLTLTKIMLSVTILLLLLSLISCWDEIKSGVTKLSDLMNWIKVILNS